MTDTMSALSDALPQLLSADAPAFKPKSSAEAPRARKPEQPRYVAPKRNEVREMGRVERRMASDPPVAGPPGLIATSKPNTTEPIAQGLRLPSGEHRCVPCGRTFSDSRALSQHQSSKHKGAGETEPPSAPPKQLNTQARLSPRNFEKDRPMGRANTTKPQQHVRQERREPEQSRQGGGGRKPKNTTCFTPSHRQSDLRVLCGPSSGKYPRVHGPRDVVLVPDFFCEERDLSIYDQLLAELQSTGKEEEGLWALWHGDSHVIANDRKGWKKSCPTFTKIVDKMAEYFGMDVKATRLNWYRDSKEWKPFHHDRAAFTPDCSQNFTVGASFGLTRDIAFQHARDESLVCSFPQFNGSMYTFGREVNVEWKHGVTQLRPEEQVAQGRISIIAWGWVPEE